jgi:hypothetical protein
MNRTEILNGEDFFALTSSAFAVREGTPLVPETPESNEELVIELRKLCDDLDVYRFFGSVQVAVRELDNWRTHEKSVADQAILILDSSSWQVTVSRYTKDESEEAAERLLEIEKENNPEILAVLVKVEDLAKLRTAYPNYYADTEVFLDAVADATRPPEATSF